MPSLNMIVESQIRYGTAKSQNVTDVFMVVPQTIETSLKFSDFVEHLSSRTFNVLPLN